MYDQNRPSTYLNTAYEALKFNPQQTNQVISSASQGAPVGLAGLAAMMAKQNQQAAQPPMQAPNQSILQQMARMQGIAGQFPAAVQLARAPTSPVQMAGGGLVAFADGGARSIAYGKTTCPVNQWAVTERWRQDAALCVPRP